MLGTGTAGDLGVHGEIAWTLPMVAAAVDDDFARAVVGGEGRPAEAAWVLGAELHSNGFGSDDVDDIVRRLKDPRVVRGEVFGAGQFYLGVLASWLASDLVSCGASLLVNVNDPCCCPALSGGYGCCCGPPATCPWAPASTSMPSGPLNPPTF